MRLHRVAPLAWAGLLLNCSVAAILQFAPHLNIEAYSLFTTANVKSFLPFIQGAIAAQAAAVMLLWLRVPGALAIAFVGGAVLRPSLSHL